MLEYLFEINLAGFAAVRVHWYAQTGRHDNRGLRGRAGHGSVRVIPEQQYNFRLERAQFGPRGHKSKLSLICMMN